MSLGMNIGLCVDLVLTLREPFYPAKRRLKYYLLFSFIMASMSSLASIDKSAETCLSPTNAGKSTVQNTILASLLSLYILISVFSVIYAARMLSRPGMSANIRTMFMKKHMFYALTFIVVWTLILLNAYDQLYNGYKVDDKELLLRQEEGYSRKTVLFPNGFYQQVWVKKGEEDKEYMDLDTFQVISFIASISTGFIMGLIRLMEPYFLFILKTFIKSLYGIPLADDEEDKKTSKLSDTITAFLSSSLNIELVHIILKAITQECTKTTIPAGDWNSFVPLDSDFEEKKKYPIEEIEIKDPSKWNLLSGAVKSMKLAPNLFGKLDKDPTTIIINEDISVEELAPKIFSIIRTREGITNTVIKNSLSPELNRDMVFKAGEGQGKSGSFFFFSHDRKFIIKTMNQEEYKTFERMFRKYYKHILKNEFSLLARIYGIFTVNKEKLMPVHLILMGNTVKLHGKGGGLKYIFDLKGSLINRECKMSKNHKPSSTLKDINLLDIKKNDNLLKFTLKDKSLIMEMIKKDVALLCDAYIMDFSLLLAIEENPNHREHASTLRKIAKSNSFGNRSIDSCSANSDMSPKRNCDGTFSKLSPIREFNDKRHMYLSSNAQYIYHIAIIDYLQYYNLDKKMEHLVKTILRGRKAEISAVCPKRYSKRYIDFMENHVFVVDRKGLSLSIEEEQQDEGETKDNLVNKK